MAGATTQAQRQAEVLAAGYNGPLTDAAINQAYANAATPSDLAQSGISNKPAVSSPNTTVNAPTNQNSAQSQQLASGINSLLGAIASGNKQAFDEAVRQFNATFGLDQSKFTEAIRQYNEGLAVSQAGLTGTYQGAQTQQAQAQAFAQQQALAGMYGQGYANFGQVPAGQQTLEAQQQAYSQQLGAINAAAALQANPFRQQQVMGQLGRVLGGQGVSGFGAPNTVQGVGTAGGTGPNTGLSYMNQLIADIQSPQANQASVNGVLDAIPTPNKLNSADFLRAPASTQQMILQGMQEKFGLDPADSLQQIRNTLPSFTAPTTFGTIRG